MAIKIVNTTVNIFDEDNKFENDKLITAKVKYNSDTKEVGVTIPITKKRDYSPNPAVFESKIISLTIHVHKDGRLAPSGRMNDKKILDCGEAKLKEEFAKAADAIWQHVKNS